ncbi:MAG: alpha-mannosidase 2c1, partial [Lentisphaeria bacterium]|nr:alpha-mannosidase 2c1 [Lentisphaeria bacterium]
TPDHLADKGEQIFTYLFLPHTGALAESEVQDRAAELNRPPLVFDGLSGSLPVPFRLAGDGVTLGAVKRAEKSEDLIIRLAEKSGRHSKAVLTFPQSVCISACDMLEWEDLSPAESADRLELEFTPFEIKTLRIKR